MTYCMWSSLSELLKESLRKTTLGDIRIYPEESDYEQCDGETGRPIDHLYK